ECGDILIRHLADEVLRVSRAYRLAIGPDRRSGLGDTIARDPDDANALSCRMLVGAEVRRGNPEWRVRGLDRPRQHVARWEIEGPALVAGKMLTLEHLHHGLEGFVGELAARLFRHPEGFGHVRRGAASETELDAAVA